LWRRNIIFMFKVQYSMSFIFIMKWWWFRSHIWRKKFSWWLNTL
jgi:hypothetical protein